MLDLLTEPLVFDFMQRALLVTSVAAVVSAVLSCWLVLIGWALLGDAVSHAVLPGVVLAYIVGVPFAVGALAFGLLSVALIGVVRDAGRLREDAAIGVVFTSLFAFGLVLISVTPSDADLGHILFGNVLGVSDGEIAQVVVLGTLALAVLLLRRRDLVLFAFDPTHAHAIGISTRRLSALLLAVVAVTVVVALQAVGVILAVAMVVIPGATARLVTDRFGAMLVIAPSVALACSIVGVYASYYLDTASGGMVVLAQGVAFTIAFVGGPLRAAVRRRFGHERSRETLTVP